MSMNILIAGFGGQGVLFAGKVLAYGGMLEGKEVSWLPSYGPEMRGGTANCNIILSDTPIGSPIVNEPDVLLAMNLPSLDKFESACVPGAKVFVDSSLIERKVARTDVQAFYVPATRMASEMGMDGLANMILVGRMLRECPALPRERWEEILQKVVSARKQNLLALNLKAMESGWNYEG